jgi:pimeloyl-ACP methyl ester carboxylesterase
MKTETWFGPEGAPLFGAVHVPADGRARGGVVVCPPIGKEQINAYRGMAYLAQQLADAGLLVLRFDYYGQGDSSGSQCEPDAVQRWRDSIRHAVDFVRDCGVPTVGLVGLRVGALLALATAPACGPLRSLTLWDPVLSGRQYLREQRALYNISVGEESDPTDVPIVGAVLAAEAAEELAGFEVDAFAAQACADRTLVATRANQPESKRHRRLVELTDADELSVTGHDFFLSPPSFIFSLPAESIGEVAAWAAGTFDGVDPVSVDVAVRRTAVVSTSPDGACVSETLDHLGPDRLFAIRTAPVSGSMVPESKPEATPTVLFTGTASEHRIGAARLWVESARTLACAGVASVRFDRRSVGETAAVSAGERSPAYSKSARADVVAAAEHSGASPGQLLIAGVCSGSWGGAYAATRIGNRALVMINPVIWNFVAGPKIRRAHVSALGSPSATRLFEIAVAIRDRLRRARSAMPYWLWLVAGRAGLAQVPEIMLDELWRRGVRTTVTLAPEDQEIFRMQRGDEGLRRMRRRGYTDQVLMFDFGDHSLHGRTFRANVCAELMRVIYHEFEITSPYARMTT